MKTIQETDHQLLQLQVNIISAEKLSKPECLDRQGPLWTYAKTWLDFATDQNTLPTHRCFTRTSRPECPRWNAKFAFTENSKLLEDAALNVEVFAVGVNKDLCVGTARCLVKEVAPVYGNKVSLVSASGEFSGVLNINATLC